MSIVAIRVQPVMKSVTVKKKNDSVTDSLARDARGNPRYDYFGKNHQRLLHENNQILRHGESGKWRIGQDSEVHYDKPINGEQPKKLINHEGKPVKEFEDTHGFMRTFSEAAKRARVRVPMHVIAKMAEAAHEEAERHHQDYHRLATNNKSDEETKKEARQKIFSEPFMAALHAGEEFLPGDTLRSLMERAAADWREGKSHHLSDGTHSPVALPLAAVARHHLTAEEKKDGKTHDDILDDDRDKQYHTLLKEFHRHVKNGNSTSVKYYLDALKDAGKHHVDALEKNRMRTETEDANTPPEKQQERAENEAARIQGNEDNNTPSMSDDDIKKMQQLMERVYAHPHQFHEIRSLPPATGFSPTNVLAALGQGLESQSAKIEAERPPLAQFLAQAIGSGLEQRTDNHIKNGIRDGGGKAWHLLAHRDATKDHHGVARAIVDGAYRDPGNSLASSLGLNPMEVARHLVGQIPEPEEWKKQLEAEGKAPKNFPNEKKKSFFIEKKENKGKVFLVKAGRPVGEVYNPASAASHPSLLLPKLQNNLTLPNAQAYSQAMDNHAMMTQHVMENQPEHPRANMMPKHLARRAIWANHANQIVQHLQNGDMENAQAVANNIPNTYTPPPLDDPMIQSHLLGAQQRYINRGQDFIGQRTGAMQDTVQRKIMRDNAPPAPEKKPRINSSQLSPEMQYLNNNYTVPEEVREYSNDNPEAHELANQIGSENIFQGKEKAFGPERSGGSLQETMGAYRQNDSRLQAATQNNPDILFPKTQAEYEKLITAKTGSNKYTGALPDELAHFQQNPQDFRNFIDRYTPEQIEGWRKTQEHINNMAENMQNLTPRQVQMHYLWGAGTQRATPFDTETGLIRLMHDPKIHQYLDRSLQGNFGDKERDEMREYLNGIKDQAKKQDAVAAGFLEPDKANPNQQETVPLTPLGYAKTGGIENLLHSWGQKDDNGRNGWDKLTEWHRDPTIGGRELRRRFWEQGLGGSGINNKILSLTSNMLGKKDIGVLDSIHGENWHKEMINKLQQQMKDKFGVDVSPKLLARKILRSYDTTPGLAAYETTEDMLHGLLNQQGPDGKTNYQYMKEKGMPLSDEHDVGSFNNGLWLGYGNRETHHGLLGVPSQLAKYGAESDPDAPTAEDVPSGAAIASRRVRKETMEGRPDKPRYGRKFGMGTMSPKDVGTKTFGNISVPDEAASWDDLHNLIGDEGTPTGGRTYRDFINRAANEHKVGLVFNRGKTGYRIGFTPTNDADVQPDKLARKADDIHNFFYNQIKNRNPHAEFSTRVRSASPNDRAGLSVNVRNYRDITPQTIHRIRMQLQQSHPGMHIEDDNGGNLHFYTNHTGEDNALHSPTGTKELAEILKQNGVEPNDSFDTYHWKGHNYDDERDETGKPLFKGIYDYDRRRNQDSRWQAFSRSYSRNKQKGRNSNPCAPIQRKKEKHLERIIGLWK